MCAIKSRPFDSLPSNRSAPRMTAPYTALALWLLLTSLLACSLPESRPIYPPTRGEPPLDLSLLTWDPCPPPCWYGLEPGGSSRSEAESVLTALGFIEGGSLQDSSPGTGDAPGTTHMTFQCVSASSTGPCGAMEFSNDLLVSISIYPTGDLTLEEVVRALGTPDALLVQRQVTDCSIGLAWARHQVFVSTAARPSRVCLAIDDGGGIGRAELVSVIRYLSHSRMASLIDQGARAWPGFAEP